MDSHDAEQTQARWLYRATMLISLVLVTGVLSAPWWTPNCPPYTGLQSLGRLLAADTFIRKTVLVGALGLWVTAIVFFYPRADTQQENTSPQELKRDDQGGESVHESIDEENSTTAMIAAGIGDQTEQSPVPSPAAATPPDGEIQGT